MNIFGKIISGEATLDDQEEALKNPITAYHFTSIHGANIEKCQEVACKVPEFACWFAQDVKGANIVKCQEAACKDPSYAYRFAHIPGANIEKCQEAVCRDPYWAYWFAKDIPGADLLKIQELCPEISDNINRLII